MVLRLALMMALTKVALIELIVETVVLMKVEMGVATMVWMTVAILILMDWIG